MAAPAAPQFFTYQKNVPLSQGQRLGFKPGSGYYAKNGLAGAAAGGGGDPYSALSGYQPLTPAQIQQQAQAQISPIISAITSQVNGNETAQASQISQYAKEIAQALGMSNLAAPYQQASQQQAAVDSALQQSLTGAGTSEAAGLSGSLKELQGSSGQGAVDQAAGALSAQGVGSGNTALANGSASLSNDLANAAAAGTFGGKMPLIADLSGIQQIGQLKRGAQQSIADAVTQAEGQLPSIIQNLQANNQTGLSNAVDARQKQQALTFEQAVGLLSAGEITPKQFAQMTGVHAKAPVKAQPTPKIVHTADGSVIAVNPTTGETVATISGPKPPGTAKQMRPQTFKGTDGRTYVYDPKTGTAKPIAGQSGPKPPSSSSHPPKLHGLTQDEYQTKAADALGGARTYHQVWKDADGNEQPPLTWQGYLTHGLKQHIPQWILIEQGKKVYTPAEIANSSNRPGG